MRRPIQALLIAASLLSSQAMAGPQEDQRARNAVRVLAEIQEIPEQGIPDKLLDEGRAVIVIPDTIKAGLVIGGRRGHGLMSVRMPNGAWSSPVFVKLTGGSIGFQAGVQSSDVVLVFRNDRSLDNLVNGKFTLGADAGVAAGPVGRNAAAATDGQRVIGVPTAQGSIGVDWDVPGVRGLSLNGRVVASGGSSRTHLLRSSGAHGYQSGCSLEQALRCLTGMHIQRSATSGSAATRRT